MNKSYYETSICAECSHADRWPDFSLQWHQLGSPLRPVAQDTGFCEDAVLQWSRMRGAPRVLILGVTPETYRLPWPDGTDIMAADRSKAMIDNVWPGPKDAVLLTDWLNVDLPDGSRDIVLCDGGLHLLSYPAEQTRLVRVLGRILSDGGLFIVRLYTPHPIKESPDAVMQDLLAGKISSLNILKLRLSMSMMENSEEGVELGSIWRAVNRVEPDLEKLAARIAWTSEHILVFNKYRNSIIRYCFVTVNHVLDMFCVNPGGFMIKNLLTPSYEMGGQCPTLVLERLPRYE